MKKTIAALAVGLAITAVGVAPAQATYAGQQVCRSASGSADNDGGVRLYPAGYEEHPDIKLDLIKGQCYTVSSDQADHFEVQLRGSGAARFRIYNTDAKRYGAWHAFRGNRDPAPVADTYARTVIEVDR